MSGELEIMWYDLESVGADLKIVGDGLKIMWNELGILECKFGECGNELESVMIAL